MRKLSFPCLLAALVVAGPIASQAPTPVEDGTLPRGVSAGIVPIHSATDEAEAAYGIWAAALPHYKVSFHGDMTFVPYLGSEYPHNQPVSWHTLSVRVGSQVLMRAVERPERATTDTRYEYRFERVVEAYDVTLAGLHQTFVVDRRPAANGDLVVEGRLATDLTAAPFDDQHRSIDLRDAEGRSLVRYGEAFALDSGGRKVPALTTFDGERVRITVPASFVQAAQFPLIVDPMLTQRGLIGGSGTRGTLDICRDDTANEYLLAWTSYASSTDLDAAAYIWFEDFAGNGTYVFGDLTTSWDNTSIRCATADDPQIYGLVITRAGPTLNNQSRIRFQIRRSGDVAFSGSVDQRIATPPGSQYWNPDIGGTTRTSWGNHFMLVWQREGTAVLGGTTNSSQIWAQPIDISAVNGGGTPSLGTLVEIPKTAGVTADAEFPSINQMARVSAIAGRYWVVCWQEWGAVNDSDWDVVVRQITSGSVPSSSAYFSPGTRHKLGPHIGGTDGRYVIFYAASSTTQIPVKALGVHGHGLDLQRIDWANGSSTITRKPVVRIRDSSIYGRWWRAGPLGYDHHTRSHWAYVMQSNQSGNVYTGRVGFNGRLTEGPTIPVDRTASNLVLGGITFDDDSDRWPILWARSDGTVMGNFFVYRGAGAPTTSGTSCSPATISWQGGGQNQQIGCEFVAVQMTGMPSGALSLVSIGFTSMSTPLPNPLFAAGCFQNANALITTDIKLGTSANWVIALSEFLAPGDVLFQGYHTNAAGNQGLTTARLRVPIIK